MQAYSQSFFPPHKAELQKAPRSTKNWVTKRLLPFSQSTIQLYEPCLDADLQKQLFCLNYISFLSLFITERAKCIFNDLPGINYLAAGGFTDLRPKVNGLSCYFHLISAHTEGWCLKSEMSLDG